MDGSVDQGPASLPCLANGHRYENQKGLIRLGSHICGVGFTANPKCFLHCTEIALRSCDLPPVSMLN